MDNLSIAHLSSEESENSDLGKGKTALEKVENTYTDEIVIGLCSPIGTVKQPLIDELVSQLSTRYGYVSEDGKPAVHIIKLSDYISLYGSMNVTPEIGHSPEFTKLKAKIDGGDDLRGQYTKNSILVELAVADILERRKNWKGKLLSAIEMKPRRICYIIDSLKNKEELLFLRSVYKDIFYLFSVFSPEHERRELLLKKNLNPGEVETLMDTDEFENTKHGQNVRGTFVSADFFVRTSNERLKKIDKTVERYLQLMFEDGVVTPLPHEQAMYAARSAADNSACMSRQVGACITDSKEHILSIGWNDVPKFGGNLYREGEQPDHRCWNYGERTGTLGFCRNDRQKDVIVKDVMQRLFESSEAKDLFRPNVLENTEEWQKKIASILREQTPIKDLIEFSRAVHAEMHAIINGSQQTGDKMLGGKLFTTTYPCHNCARHIIAAGIVEVFYIEPYVKSLSVRLHDDAITEDEQDIPENRNKVKILVFDGVAPRRFLELFSMSKNRKQQNGDKFIPDPKKLHPKFRLTLQALSTLEEQALHSLNDAGVIFSKK